jgi:hypothetical protein
MLHVSNRTLKHPKGACFVNRFQQFFPHPLTIPCLCEFIHNRPSMNLAAGRQLQVTNTCQHGADFWQHLTLPRAKPVL